MPNIIVIGASAGGIEALREIVRGLPRNLQAALFVVVHVSPTAPSILPQLLNTSGVLRADFAIDGDEIQPSRIYVAPPDHHLLIEPGRVHVVRGPREHRYRPAIDPLFRTAARTYGKRVLGIILSGLLDDGAAGLRVIASCGGTSIVQDPTDAMFSSMPLCALHAVRADHVLPVSQIPRKIGDLVTGPWRLKTKEDVRSNDRRAPFSKGTAPLNDETVDGKPSAFTCPECNGTLWELEERGLIRFRCRVGHAYSEHSARAGYDESTEAALWSATRALEESAALERRLAAQARQRGDHASGARFDDVASGREKHASIIREMLLTMGNSIEDEK